MHFGVIVDHPKRDLPGALMLAAAFGNRGARTSIIPLYEQGTDVPLLGLDALLINFARPANLDLVQGYRDMELPIYVLDTEGGVLTETGANSPSKLAAYVRSSGFADLLSGYFFWGSALRDAFVAGSGMPPDRLRVSGCPRFDYASPRWWDLLRFDRNGYVLINANFPLVNPLFVSAPAAERDSLVRAGWDRAYVDQMLNDLHGILAGYLATVKAVAAARPEQAFLVRPHPFEDILTYERAFAGLPNVVVDGRGSVLNVIRHARCILHLNCGTSIEATMLRRLPLSLEFLNTPLMALHGPLPSRISAHVGSVVEVLDAIDHVDERTAAFPFEQNYRESIRPWFYENDGGAADRVADAIQADVGSGRGAGHSITWSLGSSRRSSRLSQRLQALAANVLGSATTAAMRGRATAVRREKHFGVAEVAAAIEAIAMHEGRPALHCRSARHPWTGAALSTVAILRSGTNDE